MRQLSQMTRSTWLKRAATAIIKAATRLRSVRRRFWSWKRTFTKGIRSFWRTRESRFWRQRTRRCHSVSWRLLILNPPFFFFCSVKAEWEEVIELFGGTVHKVPIPDKGDNPQLPYQCGYNWYSNNRSSQNACWILRFDDSVVSLEFGILITLSLCRLIPSGAVIRKATPLFHSNSFPFALLATTSLTLRMKLFHWNMTKNRWLERELIRNQWLLEIRRFKIEQSRGLRRSDKDQW